VLTLDEVLQTFEVESSMFNIKLRAGDEEDTQNVRTVMLKKNYVEIEGRTKVIIMIRDETDKVKLE
jgi:hypothetical protein